MFEVPQTAQVIILAIVQGIAEFLPISSSGHLVVLNALMGSEGGSLELNVVLHFGTLLAILVFYRDRIIKLLSDDRRVIPLLIIGTIPAGLVGLYLKKYHTDLLENALLAGFMLVVTGFLLMLFAKLPNGTKKYPQLKIPPVILIGLAQAAALLPGISRSGATIVAGTATGLERQSAATFSFLLAIPAIAGAMVLEAKDMLEEGTSN